MYKQIQIRSKNNNTEHKKKSKKLHIYKYVLITPKYYSKY